MWGKKIAPFCFCNNQQISLNYDKFWHIRYYMYLNKFPIICCFIFFTKWEMVNQFKISLVHLLLH